MFCPRCSKEIEDGSRFCNHCGFAIVPAANSVKEPDAEAPSEEEPILSHSLLESQYDLKWYRFLIWFYIWFQALANGFASLRVLNLLHVPGIAGRSALRTGVWVGLTVTVLFVLYLLFVRQALARWKPYGPVLYLVSLFVPFLSRLAQVIAVNAAAGTPVVRLDGADFFILGCKIVLFVLNLIYFRKRAGLFTE